MLRSGSQTRHPSTTRFVLCWIADVSSHRERDDDSPDREVDGALRRSRVDHPVPVTHERHGEVDRCRQASRIQSGDRVTFHLCCVLWRCIVCVAGAAALGACAHHIDGVREPNRFDFACRFVPEGMASLRFMDAEAVGFNPEAIAASWFWDAKAHSIPTGATAPLPAMVVRAGRHFSPGDAEFVEVLTWEGNCVPSDWLGDAWELGSIEGTRVWFSPKAPGQPEGWYAFPAEGVGVHTTRRSLLVAALKQPMLGAAALAAELGWPDVDWQASEIILRRYDPTDLNDVFSPLNATSEVGSWPRGFDLEGIAYEQRAGPGWQYRFRAKTRDQHKTLEFFTWGVPVAEFSCHEWRSRTFVEGLFFVEDAWRGDRAHLSVESNITLDLLFGFNIFT